MCVPECLRASSRAEEVVLRTNMVVVLFLLFLHLTLKREGIMYQEDQTHK